MLASIPARWRYPEQPGRLQAIYHLLQQQPVPQVSFEPGSTVNVPLPSGSGDTAILKAFREILVPAADCFRPDLVLVSAGFDAAGIWYCGSGCRH